MDDERFMARALELAERGRLTVRPNPLVGAVIVRDGQIVGEGWHERAGNEHAEVRALAAAGDAARGATAYVTLEPCRHTGRTGPCTTALADAGVAEVVYAVDDPHPQGGGGAEILRRAGVDVRSGVLAEAAAAQNEVFLHVHRTGRPHVTLKLAQSLDGRVAARDGSSRWITSEPSRVRVHALRAASDAIVVGSGTVLADDPDLTVRHVDAPLGDPRPLVLDARGRTPAGAKVVRDGATIVTTAASDPDWRASVAVRGAEVVEVPAGEGGGVSLAATLGLLAERDVTVVLVEGGPTVAGAFVREGLADRLILHMAASLIGGDGLAAVAAPGAPSVTDAWRFDIASIDRVGPDLELVARPARRSAAGRRDPSDDGTTASEQLDDVAGSTGPPPHDAPDGSTSAVDARPAAPPANDTGRVSTSAAAPRSDRPLAPDTAGRAVTAHREGR